MILSRRPTDFESRNLLLQILLGLASADMELTQLVEAYGQPGFGEEPNEDLTFALLGVVAFTGGLRKHMDAVPPSPSSTKSSDEPQDLTGLLR